MRGLRRSIIVAVAVGALVALGVASSAAAEENDDGNESYVECDAPTIIALTVSTTANGAIVNVNGACWNPGENVTVSIASQPLILGTVVVRPDGTFDENFPVPCSIGSGDHVVTATGVSGTATAGVTLTNCGASGTLPHTGSDSFPWAGAGAALVLAGVVLALIAHRRRAVDPLKI